MADLGAGCGLAGFAALALGASRAVLTDGDAETVGAGGRRRAGGTRAHGVGVFEVWLPAVVQVIGRCAGGQGTNGQILFNFEMCVLSTSKFVSCFGFHFKSQYFTAFKNARFIRGVSSVPLKRRTIWPHAGGEPATQCPSEPALVGRGQRGAVGPFPGQTLSELPCQVTVKQLRWQDAESWPEEAPGFRCRWSCF